MLKRIMIAGALLCSAGYVLAAMATNIVVLLLSYGLLVGPGVVNGYGAAFALQIGLFALAALLTGLIGRGRSGAAW